MFRFMGIGSDGNLFTAKFQITVQNICLRIRLAKPIFITGRIDFQSQVVFNDGI